MAEDRAARHAICVQARDDIDKFGDEIDEYSDQLLRLDAEIDQLTAEIRDQEQRLNAIVTVPSRIPRSPLELGTEIGSAIFQERQRETVRNAIHILSLELAAAKAKRDESARRAEQARLNLDQTQRNFARHNCSEFNDI